MRMLHKLMHILGTNCLFLPGIQVQARGGGICMSQSHRNYVDYNALE